MATYGTHGVLDTLAVFDAQNVLEYGEDRLLSDFQRSLTAHNALVDDMLGDLIETTTDRVRRYGTESRIEMLPADEYGRSDAQKPSVAGVNLGFPLQLYQVSLQWTRKYLERSTPADLAKSMIAAQRSDTVRIRLEVQRALFNPTNNLTYVDRWTDGVTIPLRALLNADSAAIPEDDFGNTFNAATHTHYLATASLIAANLEAALTTVIEHGVAGQMFIYINRAQEAAVSALANFTAYQAPLTQPGGGSTALAATGGPLRPFDIYNRPIGVWNGAVEVWVKSWIPANYILVFEADPSRRVLGFRTPTGNAGRGTMRLVANDERYPLRADTMEREFGVSVWGREQAAILQTNNASYSAPTFT